MSSEHSPFERLKALGDGPAQHAGDALRSAVGDVLEEERHRRAAAARRREHLEVLAHQEAVARYRQARHSEQELTRLVRQSAEPARRILRQSGPWVLRGLVAGVLLYAAARLGVSVARIRAERSA